MKGGSFYRLPSGGMIEEYALKGALRFGTWSESYLAHCPSGHPPEHMQRWLAQGRALLANGTIKRIGEPGDKEDVVDWVERTLGVTRWAPRS